jgi:dTDP-4-amino-4,6-dideoxygalactose transaminase
MVCLKDKAAAARLERLRMHGIDRPVWDRYRDNKASWAYDVAELGWKCNLPDILAAIGRVQLAKAEPLYTARQEVARHYTAAFGSEDFLATPPEGAANAWHLYPIRLVPEKLTIDRDRFGALLQERGIGVSMHFIPHFCFSWFQRQGWEAKDFPQAALRGRTALSLPLWPGMSADMTGAVIEAVRDIGEAHHAP